MQAKLNVLNVWVEREARLNVELLNRFLCDQYDASTLLSAWGLYLDTGTDWIWTPISHTGKQTSALCQQTTSIFKA